VRPRRDRDRNPGRVGGHPQCGRCRPAHPGDRQVAPLGRGSGRWSGARRWWRLLDVSRRWPSSALISRVALDARARHDRPDRSGYRDLTPGGGRWEPSSTSRAARSSRSGMRVPARMGRSVPAVVRATRLAG